MLGCISVSGFVLSGTGPRTLLQPPRNSGRSGSRVEPHLEKGKDPTGKVGQVSVLVTWKGRWKHLVPGLNPQDCVRSMSDVLIRTCMCVCECV